MSHQCLILPVGQSFDCVQLRGNIHPLSRLLVMTVLSVLDCWANSSVSDGDTNIWH